MMIIRNQVDRPEEGCRRLDVSGVDNRARGMMIIRIRWTGRKRKAGCRMFPWSKIESKFLIIELNLLLFY